MTGVVLSKVASPKNMAKFFQTYERYRLNEIQRFKQMVANRHQVMDKIAELSAGLIDLALDHGRVARQLRAFRAIQIQIAQLADMEEKMTESIESFRIEHGYFLPEG